MMYKMKFTGIEVVAICLSLATVTQAFWWVDFSSRPQTDHPGDDSSRASNPQYLRSSKDHERTSIYPQQSASNRRSEAGEGTDQTRTRASGYVSGQREQSDRGSQNSNVNGGSRTPEQSRHPVHPDNQEDRERVDQFPPPGYLNSLYPPQLGHTYTREKCSCSCSNFGAQPVEPTEAGCEWRLVFKAVAGNGQSVYDDWINGGNINYDDSDAQTIASPLPYRDGDTIMHWNYVYIKWVKIEIYKDGARGTYFYFDGTASDSGSWFSPRRLIACPNGYLKNQGTDIFSIEGEASYGRRFLINEDSSSCSSKSGYLMVIDADAGIICDFDEFAVKPYFLYSEESDDVTWEDWPGGGVAMGDRFLISVMICDREL